VVAGKDLGGQFKVNVVRAYGDAFGVSHDDAFGTFKTGVWFDYQHGPRYNYFLDYNVTNAQALGLVAMPGGYLDVNHPGSAYGYAWNMHFYTRTWEPYIEYAWRPLSALTITPGVKYMSVDRAIEAPVNQTKDVLPLYFSKTYTDTLPLVTANYKLSPTWSVYAQYADGFLTPPLAFFQEDNPQLNNAKPQTTKNYQVGTVYKTSRFNADVDAYWINYSNLPVQFVNPNQTGIVNQNDLVYFDAAGAYYYGVEGEATFYVGGGFSVFANGSRNYATYKKSKRRVENVPQDTVGYGFVYDHGGFFSSLMAKYTGPYTVYSGAPSPDLPLPAGAFGVVQGGYTTVDLSLGYGSKLPYRFFKSWKARLQINNLFDTDTILLKSPKATAGAFNPLTSTYNVLTPRGLFLTVSGEF
jgi:iron complex outermembrane receptor protein